MTKYAFKTVNMMDELLVIRINLKKNSHLNNYLKKLFCQAYCSNFFSSQNSIFFKHIVLIFSLIRTALLSSILT